MKLRCSVSHMPLTSTRWRYPVATSGPKSATCGSTITQRSGVATTNRKNSSVTTAAKTSPARTAAIVRLILRNMGSMIRTGNR